MLLTYATVLNNTLKLINVPLCLLECSLFFAHNFRLLMLLLPYYFVEIVGDYERIWRNRKYKVQMFCK